MKGNLKLYSNKAWLEPGQVHEIILYPHWGEAATDSNSPDFGRFDEFMSKANSFIEYVENIEESHFVVIPFEYAPSLRVIQKATEIAAIAERAGKKAILFYNTDDPSEITIKNVVIFRTSFLRSCRKENEFSFPGWSVDFSKAYAGGTCSPLAKTVKPTVSYCGYVDSLEPSLRLLKIKLKNLFLGENFYSKGARLRGQAVRALSADERVSCDFIIRDGFWAGASSAAEQMAVRKEYADNMLRNPYGLVVRGVGNFSYRLYEIMSCGRIPVFINTDSVLPLESLIDWKKHCVWIEESEVTHIAERVSHFHSTISNQEFVALQMNNRAIYEEFLSPVGFFQSFHHEFQEN